MIILPLPDDDEVLIPREEVHLYGGPRPATLAKYACQPSQAPVPLPYTLIGRRAAYRVGDLRRLRAARTFRNTTERTVTRSRVRSGALAHGLGAQDENRARRGDRLQSGQSVGTEHPPEPLALDRQAALIRENPLSRAVRTRRTSRSSRRTSRSDTGGTVDG